MAKILLVEDNEMNRDMLSRRLVRSGYHVVMAVDGRRGHRRRRRRERPDLILMDMSLPGDRRLGGDTPAEGGRSDPTHPGHRADRARDGRAIARSARGGLRRLRHQAGRLQRLLPKIQTALQRRSRCVSRPTDPLLVVDDNECNRDMLSRRLQRLGYDVVLAADVAPRRWSIIERAASLRWCCSTSRCRA